jgi:hypothetical protein
VDRYPSLRCHPWRGFRDARSFFMDAAVASATRALRPVGFDDIALVKVVPDNDKLISETPREEVAAYVVLVWRPDLNRHWRIHSIGSIPDPATLPRTAQNGEAPRYQKDADVKIAPNYACAEPST